MAGQGGEDIHLIRMFGPKRAEFIKAMCAF